MKKIIVLGSTGSIGSSTLKSISKKKNFKVFLLTANKNIKKLLNQSIKWHGLNGLDLAKNVSTRKKYNWNNLKTWKKDVGFEKNKKKIFACGSH